MPASRLIQAAITRPARSAFATALVLWAVALSVIILAGLQMSAFRQANDGREVLGRLRASWAARAGVERVVAKLQLEADAADPMGANSLLSSLAQDAQGEFAMASFAVVHPDPAAPGGVAPGPTDPQSKLNINSLAFDDLMLLPDMTEDIADAILDYIDADDDVREMGAEREAYSGLTYSYKPRNGPLRDIRELEMVSGVKPEWVRGEDWNLNGILDPNENDGDASWPPDNADGVLDAGWSAYLTAAGSVGGIGVSGQERIDLSTADSSQIAQALGIDDQQAQTVATHGQKSDALLEDFIRSDLATLAQKDGGGGGAGGGGGGGRGRQPQIKALTRDQTALLLEECAIGDPKIAHPGKININTASDETLEYLSKLTPTMRDALILYRDQAGGDIKSLTDLLDVPQMTAATLADLYPYIEVRSNVFQVVSRGRDAATGVTIEIVAEVDRSTQPVTIRRLVIR